MVRRGVANTKITLTTSQKSFNEYSKRAHNQLLTPLTIDQILIKHTSLACF